MRSIFRYPGGKSALAAEIMALAPAGYQEYREPFVGGGGVFFGVPQEKRRWINDRDGALVAVYEALRDDPESFIRSCRQIRPLEGAEGAGRLKAIFDRFAGGEDVDPALRYYFLHRTIWGGLPSRIEHAQFFSNPEGWNIVKSERMWQAAGLLRGVDITAGDYLPLLREAGEGVWVYCDPPYYRLDLLPRASRLYAHYFTGEQHALFAEHVGACGHNVLVSYDDHPFIRALYSYPEFRIRPVKMLYRLRDGAKYEGHELLISNYG